jgi:hypothetical protein
VRELSISQQTTTPLPQTRKPKRSLWKWIAIAVAAIVIISVAVFLLSLPRPEIVLTDGHDGLQGLNYVGYVDVTVKNNGGSGWVTVHAELSGGGRFERQEQRVYVQAGKTENVQFVFDITIWNSLFSSMQYKAWATPF